jgi:CHAT domain-containing protein/tetratricopeptide (TPR) repeat protein
MKIKPFLSLFLIAVLLTFSTQDVKSKIPESDKFLPQGIAFDAVCFSINLACPKVATTQFSSPRTESLVLAQNNNNSITTAQQEYEAGRYDNAIEILQETVNQAVTEGDIFTQAIALRNLSLVYHQTDQLNLAETAISQSLELLKQLEQIPETQQALAQSLDLQGQIQLNRGEVNAALTTWQNAANLYQQLNDLDGLFRSQINQTEALQGLGLYREAKHSLDDLRNRLNDSPNTLLKAKALQSLGDVLRAAGDLETSSQVLQESLEIAENLENRDAIALAYNSLGNTARLQEDNAENALLYYRYAAEQSPTPELQIQAQLNELDLLIALNQIEPALILIELIQPNLNHLSSSRNSIYARVNLAQNLMKLGQENLNGLISQTEIAQLLATAINDAQTIQDNRSQAYALNSLSQLYRQNHRDAEAQQLLERSILLTQGLDAADISYQNQWQLAQLLEAKGDRHGAIAAYHQSVQTLKTLRGDLVAASSDLQYSFRDRVEPIYRQYVNLLLSAPNPTSYELQQAREALEALQLAELDNYFREACTNVSAVQIDQLDSESTVLYTAILGDRLATILAIPGQPLRHYSVAVTADQLERTIKGLGRALGLDIFINRSSRSDAINTALESGDNPSRSIASVRARDPELAQFDWQKATQDLYDWIVRPAIADLERNHTETLVFVLDGVLRNLPMAILHDGQQYLIESYAIALSPGLQLLDPKPLPREQLSVLAAGLSESNSDFSDLPNVEIELQQIQQEVPARVLLNAEFTKTQFSQLVKASPSPIVHLATHGQFSSAVADTFILTWDDKLDPNELNALLSADTRQKQPIELLILSACQTATGDDRAILGLAGVATRAGARSTLASLWSVSDAATAQLMARFYQEFAHSTVSKAEALRRSQLQLLHSDSWRDPYFWAAFVLVGNWL